TDARAHQPTPLESVTPLSKSTKTGTPRSAKNASSSRRTSIESSFVSCREPSSVAITKSPGLRCSDSIVPLISSSTLTRPSSIDELDGRMPRGRRSSTSATSARRRAAQGRRAGACHSARRSSQRSRQRLEEQVAAEPDQEEQKQEARADDAPANEHGV